MADPQVSIIKFRTVPGQFNKMAVCSACDRDATQTRMTRYCLSTGRDAVPLLCDQCRDEQPQ